MISRKKDGRLKMENGKSTKSVSQKSKKIFNAKPAKGLQRTRKELISTDFF
jgi:hypothetical protein